MPVDSARLKVASRCLLAGVSGLLLISAGQAQLAPDLLSGTWKASGVEIPFFIGMEQQPAAVMRAERIYTDYQRKGFFRIGVLPIAVMEDVTFELRQAEALTNSLVQLHRWLGPKAASRLEFRRVNFQIGAAVTNCLQAGRVRVVPGGQWELLDGVCSSVGTNQVRAARATLQITGDHTGQFVMATSPPLTNNLFARTEITQLSAAKYSHEN